MKYLPLKNQPNISGSRLESISPSLKLDNRNFPYVSWLEQGNNINEVNFSYWDGLKWSFYDVPKVYISSQNIVFSPNALVLDSYSSPVIAFARKIGSGYRLSLASYNSGWSFSNYDVDYEVGWIGVIKIPDSADSSSSSSSSSAGILHSVYYVAVYDSDNGRFIVFSVEDVNWTPLSALSASVDNFESVRIDACRRKMGIAYVVSNAGSSSSSSGSSGYFQSIKYNFFDLDASTWSFPVFRDLNYSLLYGEIIDMDIGGYWDTNSMLAFGWISRTATASYVCSVLADDTGTETPSNNTSPVIKSQDIDAYVSSDYIVNGYRKIALCMDNSDLIRIVVTGASSDYFRLAVIGAVRYWLLDSVDIEGISNGIVPTYVRFGYSGDTKLVMAADSGDIYYFEESADTSFPLSNPNMVLLNDKWVYVAGYSNGQLSGLDISGTYNNEAGAVLVDSEKPLLIVSNKSTPVTTTTTTLP